jgi:nucleoside-diphosphate-sugar epimerase
MRVFITGATGYLGSAVVRDLIEAGHQVTGLARSDSAAEALTAAGATAHPGTLEDLAAIRSAAAAADGVVHTAFGAVRRSGNLGSAEDYAAAVRSERAAIEAIGDTLAGSGRPFVVTSGTAGQAPGRVATEDDGAEPGAAVALRAPMEPAALSLAARDVRVSVVRLAPSVHGPGDRGFVPALIEIARSTGVSGYPGDGANRWCAVHRLDAARLYRLALESAPAGARLHAVADEGIRLREIAESIGRHLHLPATGVPTDHFGWFAPFVTLDNPATSDRTRKLLAWYPTHPALLPDLDEGHYFHP